MDISSALNAVWLKLNRTLALRLAPLAPLVIIGLQLAIVAQQMQYCRDQQMMGAWEQFAQQTVFLWTLLMLPLFITLETALLGNLEHASGQWKHLFALATSRLAQYSAKQIVAMVLIAVSMVALYIYIIISGLVLRVAAPGLGLEAAVPRTSLLRYIGYSCLI